MNGIQMQSLWLVMICVSCRPAMVAIRRTQRILNFGFGHWFLNRMEANFGCHLDVLDSCAVFHVFDWLTFGCGSRTLLRNFGQQWFPSMRLFSIHETNVSESWGQFTLGGSCVTGLCHTEGNMRGWKELIAYSETRVWSNSLLRDLYRGGACETTYCPAGHH